MTSKNTIEYNIQKIIADAYRVFKKYPAQKPLDICTGCCVSKQEEIELLNSPVQEIEFHTLCSYTDSASSFPKKSQNEILHFLPRYFDYIAQFQYPSHISEETCLRHLKNLDFKLLSEKESQLIRDFGQYFSLHFLQSSFGKCDFVEVDAILIMLTAGKYPLNPLLESWLKNDNHYALLHYRELVFSRLDYTIKNLANPFADEKTAKQIYDWATDPKTQQIMKEKTEQIVLLAPKGIREDELEALSLLYECL